MLGRVPAAALGLALGSGLARLLLTGQRVASRALEQAGHSFSFAALDRALADIDPHGRARD